jgi:hypothetical protein
MVCLPCLLCGTRAVIGKRLRKTPPDPPLGDSLALALEDEHRHRYDSVRLRENADRPGFRSPACVGRQC